MDTSCSNATLSDSDDEEEAKEVPDPLYSCAKRSHKRCVKTGVTVFIPPNTAIPHKSTEKTGDLISEVSIELIEEWNCAECVAGMVFDTTSSNTGCKTAACVALQNRLNRPLLWYACRHHVGEILLTHVWDALKIEVSKSPEILLFKRFKENFASITHQNKDLHFPELPADLLGRKSEVIELCKNYLTQPFSRGDYKELLSLALLYLSEGSEVEAFRMLFIQQTWCITQSSLDGKTSLCH